MTAGEKPMSSLREFRFHAALALALVTVSFPVAGNTADDQPYAMRGVQLGITIDEFRSFPPPAHKDFVRSAPVCSNDPGETYEFVIDDVARRLGEQDCHWVGDIPMPSFPNAPPLHTEMPVKLGDGYGQPEFRFFPAADGTLRLMQISVSSHVTYWDAFLAAYSEKYGKPSTTTEVVQNGYGASFDKLTATWANEVSTIVLVSRCDKIDDVCISYTDLPLNGLYNAAIRRAKGDPGANL